MTNTRYFPVVLLCLALLAGCASKRPLAINLPTDDPARLAEATKLCSQGDEARTKGDLDRAVDFYRQALNLRDDWGAVWNNMGMALLARNQYMDRVWAADCYRKAADLMPRDSVPLENLAMLYAERLLFDEAIEYYAQALERQPNSKMALRGAIEAAARLGRSDEATRDRIRRAIMRETDPKWLDIFDRQRLRVEGDLAEKARQEKEGE